MSSERKLKVFLCHSSGDKPAVRDLYKRLQADRFDPWLDEEDILPGHEWENEIRKAVRATEAIIVCLSQSSISKEGFVQKEISDALNKDNQPVLKLTRVASGKVRRKAGSAKGLISIAEDFDAPLEEFQIFEPQSGDRR